MTGFMKMFAVAALTLVATVSQAKTYDVKMLNNGKDGIMVFEPAFLKVAKGDSVKFIPTDAAHDVASVALPKGAKPFHGEANKELTVKLTEEGVYLYECKAHITMAMIGVIQVGKATNVADVEKAGQALAPQFALNKDRLAKYMGQITK